MHLRSMTVSRPAPASEIAFLLDAISQLLSIISTIQGIVSNTITLVTEIGGMVDKEA